LGQWEWLATPIFAIGGGRPPPFWPIEAAEPTLGPIWGGSATPKWHNVGGPNDPQGPWGRPSRTLGVAHSYLAWWWFRPPHTASLGVSEPP
jgi:hypothetical protein